MNSHYSWECTVGILILRFTYGTCFKVEPALSTVTRKSLFLYTVFWTNKILKSDRL